MKKILSLSILAATLASTAAFAGPGAGPSAKDVLLVSSNGAPNVLEVARIAQNAIDSSVANKVVQANFMFDKSTGYLKSGKLVLAQALGSNDDEAIQTAISANVHLAVSSQGAGWEFAKFEAGQGPDLGTLYVIDGRKDHNEVQAIAIHAERTSVTFEAAQVDKTIAADLTKNKAKAALALTH